MLYLGHYEFSLFETFNRLSNPLNTKRIPAHQLRQTKSNSKLHDDPIDPSPPFRLKAAAKITSGALFLPEPDLQQGARQA